jgi:hypothetical protein
MNDPCKRMSEVIDEIEELRTNSGPINGPVTALFECAAAALNSSRPSASTVNLQNRVLNSRPNSRLSDVEREQRVL